MKLYATVKSNRAIKGQGGEYLEINIYNEKEELSHYITAGDGILCLYKNNPKTNFDGVLLYKTKIKKVTDEKPFKKCKICDGDLRLIGSIQCGLIHDQYQNTKSKKQKGEKWQDVDIQTGELVNRHE